VKGHGLAADAVGAELLEHRLLRVVDWGGGAVCLDPAMLSILLDASCDFVQLYIFFISESSQAW
jgi:hypothetical protein